MRIDDIAEPFGCCKACIAGKKTAIVAALRMLGATLTFGFEARMNLLAQQDLTPRPAAAAGRKPLIERLIYLVALVGPFTSLPQILEIWVKDRSAVGVSLITWVFFFVMSALWFVYGVTKRDRPLMISNGLWMLAEAVIIAGALYYDNDWL